MPSPLLWRFGVFMILQKGSGIDLKHHKKRTSVTNSSASWQGVWCKQYLCRLNTKGWRERQDTMVVNFFTCVYASVFNDPESKTHANTPLHIFPLLEQERKTLLLQSQPACILHLLSQLCKLVNHATKPNHNTISTSCVQTSIQYVITPLNMSGQRGFGKDEKSVQTPGKKSDDCVCMQKTEYEWKWRGQHLWFSSKLLTYGCTGMHVKT